jgi:hypothetical protein
MDSKTGKKLIGFCKNQSEPVSSVFDKLINEFENLKNWKILK